MDEDEDGDHEHDGAYRIDFHVTRVGLYWWKVSTVGGRVASGYAETKDDARQAAGEAITEARTA